jgi:hypothetical protein
MKEDSRLLGASLFRRGPHADLEKHTLVCYPWTDKLKAITFTGLPQAVIDFNYHQEELDALKKLPDVIISAIKGLLQEQQFGGTGGGELTIERLKLELFDPFEVG